MGKKPLNQPKGKIQGLKQEGNKKISCSRQKYQARVKGSTPNPFGQIKFGLKALTMPQDLTSGAFQ